MKTSISALESSLRATEGSSGGWETFGWLCAIAVGVGIAGEIAVIVSEYLEDLEDWERGTIRAPDKPPGWRFWFDVAATLLVLGGVFGEAGAAARVSSINSELRSKTSELRAKSDRLLAVITEEAGDAAISVETAQEELDSVTRQTEELKSDLSKAETEAEALHRQLAADEKDVNELRKSLAPRQDLALIQSHGKSNIDEMKNFPELEVILVFAPEYLTMGSAGEIEQRVTDAGWKVVSRIPNASVWPGVKVYRHLGPDISGFGNPDELRSKGAADALCRFLHSFDWDCDVEMGSRALGPSNVPPNTIRVEVGLKPEPYFTAPWDKPLDPNKPIKQQMDEQKKALQEEIERHLSPK